MRHGRAGLPWLPSEDATLRDMWAEIKPDGEIAKVLGRSPESVATRRAFLKMKAHKDINAKYNGHIPRRSRSSGFERRTGHRWEPISAEAHAAAKAAARIRACTLHLVDLMRDFEATTVGQGRAAYVAKHELAIEQERSAPTLSHTSRATGSGCSSPAGWME